MDGQNWGRLKWIAFWINLKNFGPPFFQIYISFYQNVICTARKTFSVVYVAVILQMKDSCSANLTLTELNKII